MTTQTDHAALSRDLYTLKGEMKGVSDSVARIEHAVTDGFTKVEARLAALEAKENQRRGVVATLMFLSGVVGGLVVKFGSVLLGALK